MNQSTTGDIFDIVLQGAGETASFNI